MKSFVSNDNSSSHKLGQGGVSIKIEPTCHGVHVDARLTWEAAEHLNCFFVALGEFKQVIHTQRLDGEDRDQRKAERESVYEARRQDNLNLGKRCEAGVEDLCAQGYTRHDAVSRIASSFGKPISEINALIKLHKKETRIIRQDNTKTLMLAGKSASEIGKELGVSKSQAHRIMQSVKGTDDV